MPLVRKYAAGQRTGDRDVGLIIGQGVVFPPRRVAMKYGSHIVGNRYRAQAAEAVQARLERRWFVYECVR